LHSAWQAPRWRLICLVLARAAQAYGAGNLAAIGGHFRVATVFLLLHLPPLLALLVALPLLLQRAETEHDMGFMAGRYVRLMLPSLVFECLNRPMNSTLVAQRITTPQMIIQVGSELKALRTADRSMRTYGTPRVKRCSICRR
jgi:Na+-driven multidrug efflux pump